MRKQVAGVRHITSHHICDPQSPRHTQPDWLGGGLMSRQMMHAPPSAAIFVCKFPWLWMGAGRRMGSPEDGSVRRRSHQPAWRSAAVVEYVPSFADHSIGVWPSTGRSTAAPRCRTQAQCGDAYLWHTYFGVPTLAGEGLSLLSIADATEQGVKARPHLEQNPHEMLVGTRDSSDERCAVQNLWHSSGG